MSQSISAHWNTLVRHWKPPVASIRWTKVFREVLCLWSLFLARNPRSQTPQQNLVYHRYPQCQRAHMILKILSLSLQILSSLALRKISLFLQVSWNWNPSFHRSWSQWLRTASWSRILRGLLAPLDLSRWLSWSSSHLDSGAQQSRIVRPPRKSSHIL